MLLAYQHTNNIVKVIREYAWDFFKRSKLGIKNKVVLLLKQN